MSAAFHQRRGCVRGFDRRAAHFWFNWQAPPDKTKAAALAGANGFQKNIPTKDQHKVSQGDLFGNGGDA